MLNKARQFFTDHRPHTPTEKGKIKEAQCHAPSLNRCDPTHHRLFPSSPIPRIAQSECVWLTVGKKQRIARPQPRIVLNKRTTVHDEQQALFDRQTEMYSTFRADKQASFDFLAEEDLLTPCTFEPDRLGLFLDSL